MVYRTHCTFCHAPALNVGNYLPAICSDCARRCRMEISGTAQDHKAFVVRYDGKRREIVGVPSGLLLDNLFPKMEESLELMRH